SKNQDLANQWVALFTGNKYMTQMATTGGVIPNNTSMLNLGTGINAVFYGAAKNSKFVPNSENWASVENANVLPDMLVKIFTKQSSIPDATTAASARIAHIINGGAYAHQTSAKGAGSMGVAVVSPDLEPAHRSRRTVNLLPYALISPSVAVIGGILAFPLGMLVWLSLQHYGLRELIQHSGEWLGLDNYRTILADPLFRQVIVRSLLFTFACVALTVALSTLIALLLLKVRRPIRVLMMSALVFVWATPVIVTVDIWQLMFDYEFGVINYLLTQLHFGNFIHHNWFDNPIQGWGVVLVIVVWGAIPFVAITLFAGLLQVPGDIVDAAQVDGAGPW